MEAGAGNSSQIVRLDRRVRQIEPSPQPDAETRLFSDFSGHKVVILLGDPGSGKTELFRSAAEGGAGELLTVRSFMRRPVAAPAGRRLFIDGLDEYRTEGGAKDNVDGLVTRLIELGRPSFFLSCRAADWFGNSDMLALNDIHGSNVTVVQLLPLEKQDIIEIARAQDQNFDGEKFYREAMDRGLDDLLGNPQTLLMLLETVGNGQWPKGRFDLYDRACRLLVRELNEEHLRIEAGQKAEDELLDAAGAASAAILIANEEGIALSRQAVCEGFPFVDDFPADRDQLTIAARRRLFSTAGIELVVPVHNTVAEFLAARYLAQRVRGGFPLNRMLSLITGTDGGTVSSLRGMFAWLTCHLQEEAGSLVPIDPYGVLRYGDVSRLPLTTRKQIVDELGTLEDPWFRERGWIGGFLGELSSPEMVEMFMQILHCPSSNKMGQIAG